ncbi:MAG: PorP/SprF family type IX secretion system membrane protein [Cytophagaceae bacterium]
MKRLLLIVFVMINISDISAQDIHYTQFYNSPLSLNPALTGFFRQDFRISANYRTQWKQAKATFETVSLGGEVNFPVKPERLDRVGVGVWFLNDDMGDKIIRNKTFFTSIGYNRFLDHSRKHKIGVGLQGGYVRKGIDYSSLQFGNQYADYQYDPNLASNEDMSRNTFAYFNINAGIYGDFKLNKDLSVHTGISWFNINKPKESFRGTVISTDLNKLRNRFLWTGGAVYQIDPKFSLHPDVMLMFQSGARDWNLGTAVGYKVGADNPALIKLGVWYRTRDAVIAYAGLNYKNFQLGLSYDKTISGLNDVKKSSHVNDNAMIGAVEVSLIYVGFFKRALPGKQTIPCGIF